jgi:hypothetical protein
MNMRIEILGFQDCPNYRPAVERARTALQQAGAKGEIQEVMISNPTDAKAMGFLGSPSIRVNGLDIEPAARTATQFGYGCRTYLVDGVRQGAPPQEWIDRAISDMLAGQNERY